MKVRHLEHQQWCDLQEPDQRPSADEEDRCWISSLLHDRYRNFPSSLEARKWQLEKERQSGKRSNQRK